MIKATLGLVCAAFLAGAASGAEISVTAPVQVPNAHSTNVINLWPEGTPGKLGDRPEDVPTLTIYPAPRGSATGAAMVVCPGGGYSRLADHEGTDYARWLNEMGISAFVLKYRLGSSGYRYPAMLNDAARAVRIVRAGAEKWGIDPRRVGIIGSSAGGHLASTLLTHFDAGNAASTDTVERQSSRPDLGILCYPVITMGEQTHAGSKRNLLGDNPSAELVDLLSNEKQVSAQTPPTFLFHTADDTVVPVQNSLIFATALADHDVPFELHIYPHGKHGIGLGSHEWNPSHRHDWTKAAFEWLKANKFAHEQE